MGPADRAGSVSLAKISSLSYEVFPAQFDGLKKVT